MTRALALRARAAALLLLVAAGCGGSHPKAAPAVPRLTSIGELRDAFNRDAGEPRLVVLISPT
jgi:hypothetical protein